jgi:hypothetical protein
MSALFDPIAEAIAERPRRAMKGASEANVIAAWRARLAAEGWREVQFLPLVRNRNTTVMRVTAADRLAVLKMNVARPYGSGVAAAASATRLNADAVERGQPQPCPTVLGVDESSDSALFAFVRGRGVGDGAIPEALRLLEAIHGPRPGTEAPVEQFVRSIEAYASAVLPDYWRRYGRRQIGTAAFILQAPLAMDFAPRNVLQDESGRLWFIDPPDRRLVGPIAWDIAVFFQGLHAAWYRSGRLLSPRSRDELVLLARDAVSPSASGARVPVSELALAMAARIVCVGHWLSGSAGYRGALRGTILRAVRRHYVRSAEQYLIALSRLVDA